MMRTNLKDSALNTSQFPSTLSITQDKLVNYHLGNIKSGNPYRPQSMIGLTIVNIWVKKLHFK